MAVLNKHKAGIPAGAVCEKHAEYLRNQVRSGKVSLIQLAALHGKNLVCFCAPLRCHGDTLVKAAAWAVTQIA